MGASMQTRIRVDGEDNDWKEPVHLRRRRPEPVPLVLDVAKEESGTLTVTCSDSSGFVLGALMELSPQDTFATLVARVNEDISPPPGPGGHWQIVVGERCPDHSESDMALADLFSV